MLKPRVAISSRDSKDVGIPTLKCLNRLVEDLMACDFTTPKSQCASTLRRTNAPSHAPKSDTQVLETLLGCSRGGMLITNKSFRGGMGEMPVHIAAVAWSQKEEGCKTF